MRDFEDSKDKRIELSNKEIKDSDLLNPEFIARSVLVNDNHNQIKTDLSNVLVDLYNDISHGKVDHNNIKDYVANKIVDFFANLLGCAINSAIEFLKDHSSEICHILKDVGVLLLKPPTTAIGLGLMVLSPILEKLLSGNDTDILSDSSFKVADEHALYQQYKNGELFKNLHHDVLIFSSDFKGLPISEQKAILETAKEKNISTLISTRK